MNLLRLDKKILFWKIETIYLKPRRETNLSSFNNLRATGAYLNQIVLRC
jgi:hypothetical protein